MQQWNPLTKNEGHYDVSHILTIFFISQTSGNEKKNTIYC